MKIPINFTSEQLDRLGNFFVKEVQKEARKYLAKQEGIFQQYQRAGIPNSERFFNSFYHKVSGNKILLYSKWPWIKSLLEGREPYEMDWLFSQPGKPKIIPIKEKGTNTIIFRVAPLQTEKSWIHPGVAKHNFLEKAKKSLYKEIKVMILHEIMIPVIRKKYKSS